MATLRVLLPALSRCADDPLLREWLRRGDRLAAAAPGRESVLRAAFEWSGRSLPTAALTREALAGDAGDIPWLCADPAHVQPDLAGARMLACGNLDLDAGEAVELAAPLRPLFGDQGLLLELTEPARWHLRLQRGTPVPDFDPPEAVLGADLLAHLPAGPDGRRWRALFNEAQVILHQHPRNALRRAAGRMTINCIWLWGGGALPDRVRSTHTHVVSADPLLRALAQRVGAVQASDAATLLELPRDAHGLLDLAASDGGGITAALDTIEPALRRGRIDTIELASDDGRRVRVRRWHRWRFWRRAP
jgi:hypothetical protein